MVASLSLERATIIISAPILIPKQPVPLPLSTPNFATVTHYTYYNLRNFHFKQTS